MSQLQHSSLNFLSISIIILFAVFLIKINRKVQDLRLQVLRLSQQLADLIAQQELSAPKSDSHSEPLHTCTDISLTNFSLNERKSHIGGNAEATNGNIVNDRDNIASSDVPSLGVEPGTGRVQTFGFYQSVQENQTVLEGHGYSKSDNSPIPNLRISILNFSTAILSNCTVETLLNPKPVESQSQPRSAPPSLSNLPTFPPRRRSQVPHYPLSQSWSAALVFSGKPSILSMASSSRKVTTNLLNRSPAPTLPPSTSTTPSLPSHRPLRSPPTSTSPYPRPRRPISSLAPFHPILVSLYQQFPSIPSPQFTKSLTRSILPAACPRRSTTCARSCPAVLSASPT